MPRNPNANQVPKLSKRPVLPPKRAMRPALKPQPRVMNKQHRGGR
jgi:hypothetical protein